MIPTAPLRRLVTAALVLALAWTSSLHAGDGVFAANFGTTTLNTGTSCPVKQFPTFESIAPIPGSFPPPLSDFLPVFCTLQVTRDQQGVKKAKGTYTAQLLVRDNETGLVETHDIDSGTFRTGRGGFADWQIEIPPDLIFADGFESGNTSAWSYTRTDFSNKKKANNVALSCSAARNN